MKDTNLTNTDIDVVAEIFDPRDSAKPAQKSDPVIGSDPAQSEGPFSAANGGDGVHASAPPESNDYQRKKSSRVYKAC